MSELSRRLWIFAWMCGGALILSSSSSLGDAPAKRNAPSPAVKPAGPRNIVARFRFTTALGHRRLQIVRIEGNEVYANGVPVDTASLLLAHTDLITAFSFHQVAWPRMCHAGTYEQEITDGSKRRTEKGCIEDPRFATLHQGYSHLVAAAGHSDPGKR